jgi:hypothetical protein
VIIAAESGSGNILVKRVPLECDSRIVD